MHWKKPLTRLVGVFLLAGLLLFIAGELAAETSREGFTGYYCRHLNIWDQPDTLTGGGGNGDAQSHDDTGDPDDVDAAPPATLWFMRWFFSRYCL